MSVGMRSMMLLAVAATAFLSASSACSLPAGEENTRTGGAIEDKLMTDTRGRRYGKQLNTGSQNTDTRSKHTGGLLSACSACSMATLASARAARLLGAAQAKRALSL